MTQEVNSPDHMEFLLKAITEGAAPPCVAAGVMLCRGCPDWSTMLKAIKDPTSGWDIIHCPATGLTIQRIAKRNS